MTGSWRKILAILNLAGFAGTVFVNFLANSLPINGVRTGEISDRYPNLFTPAGFTFSIWGIIYLLLAAFVIFQVVSAFNRSGKGVRYIEQIGFFFVLASIANMAWIFAWHHQQILLSVILMVILLVSLISIYLRTSKDRSDADRSTRFLVHIPFSIYLGWITVATIANITVLLVSTGWNRMGIGETTWTSVVLIIAGAIGLLMIRRHRDIYFNLVLIWALAGIIARRLGAETGTDWTVVTIAMLVIINLIINLFLLLRRKKAREHADAESV